MNEHERHFVAMRSLFIASFEGTHGRVPDVDEATEGAEYLILHRAVFDKGSREAWLSYHRLKKLPYPDLALNSKA